MKGTVKWFNVNKGFGFIAGEDGNDYFAHYREIEAEEGSFRKLRERDEVEFTVSSDEQGRPMAAGIRRA